MSVCVSGRLGEGAVKELSKTSLPVAHLYHMYMYRVILANLTHDRSLHLKLTNLIRLLDYH